MKVLKTVAAAATLGGALGLAALGAGAGIASATPASPGIPWQQDGWWGHHRWDHGGWGPGAGWYGGGPGWGGYGGPAGGCVSGPLGFVSVCI